MKTKITCNGFQRHTFEYFLQKNGGEAGIRTLGPPKGSTDFESAPFDHSGTSPRAPSLRADQSGDKFEAWQSIRRLPVPGLVLLSLFFLSACDSSNNKLESVKAAGELVVLTRMSPTTYYKGPDGYAGIEYDMAKAFAGHLGVKLKMVVPEHFDDIFSLLINRKADFAAAGLSVTPARKKVVRFTPAYQRIQQQLIYRQGTEKPKTFTDIVGDEIIVTSGTAYVERLKQMKRRLKKLEWKEVKDKNTEDLIQMVAEGTLTYTIADSNIVDVNRPLYPDLRIALNVQHPESLAWAFPKSDDDSLYNEASKFIRKLKRSGEIKVLLERYYGVTDADYFNMTLFQLRIQNILPTYRRMFELAGKKYAIDWRLLAAISYQESYWNPRATSQTGVRGMMMLTKNTADQIGVKNRLDPKQSIPGGARYLRKIIDLIPESVEEPDRTWLAMASYNVGYSHLMDARDITLKQKANPDKWNDVKQRLPLLSRLAFYRNTKYGYARGHEPVRFVSRIRRYYDVLVKLDKKERKKQRNEAIGLTAPAI